MFQPVVTADLVEDAVAVGGVVGVAEFQAAGGAVLAAADSVAGAVCVGGPGARAAQLQPGMLLEAVDDVDDPA